MKAPRQIRCHPPGYGDVLIATLRKMPDPWSGEFNEDWCLFARPAASKGNWLSLRLAAAQCHAHYKAAYWLGWHCTARKFARWPDSRKLFEGRRALHEYVVNALTKLQSVARLEDLEELNRLKELVAEYREYLDSEVAYPEQLPAEWLPQPLKGLDKGLGVEACETPAQHSPLSLPAGPLIIRKGQREQEGESAGDEPLKIEDDLL